MKEGIKTIGKNQERKKARMKEGRKKDQKERRKKRV